jgi:hypothetical protein
MATTTTNRTATAGSKRLHPLTEIEHLPGYEWATTRWLRRQVFERKLTHYKVSGRVLVDLDDLDRYVQAGRRDAS